MCRMINYLNFKIKTEISNAIKVETVISETVSRRAESVTYHSEQRRQELQICKCFNIQLIEATDICVFPEYFLLFARFSKDGITKEVVLKTTSLHGKNRGKRLYASLLEINVTLHKIVSIITDGTPAMNIENAGLTEFCKKKIPLSRVFLLNSASFIS